MNKQQAATIHYGFGPDYLKDWDIRCAFREVYQNFIDWGAYSDVTRTINDKLIEVSISNKWVPESLDFLRIGNSKKHGNNSIGKHGEGLKMAFLIFERMGFKSRIFTNKYVIFPSFYADPEIGQCFCLRYAPHFIKDQAYTVQFQCDPLDYSLFRGDIITVADIVFSHSGYGDIVDREEGHIYSGGLFVTAVQNMSRSYNIRPEYLPLDRDRSVPRAFDVNWAASKILESYEKFSAKDLTYSDTEYITRVPETLIPAFKPRQVGNSIQFTMKDDTGKDVIVSNSSIQRALSEHSFFAAAIKRLKRLIGKDSSLYDLLVAFKKKHLSYQTEAIHDFDVILERVKK